MLFDKNNFQLTSNSTDNISVQKLDVELSDKQPENPSQSDNTDQPPRRTSQRVHKPLSATITIFAKCSHCYFFFETFYEHTSCWLVIASIVLYPQQTLANYCNAQ